MQISSINQINTSHTSKGPLQNILENLSPEDKRIFKEALLKVPNKELPKILQALNKIPPDENYIKNLLTTINEKTQNNPKGFMIYA